MFDKPAKELIWNQLQKIALEDRMLSQEEQELILTVIADIEQYNHALKLALEDNIIDEMEQRRLFEGRMNVMEKAYAKAREDSIITGDEKKILKEICKIIIDTSHTHQD